MSTFKWSLISKTPVLARSSHCLVTTQNNKIFIYAGELSGSDQNQNTLVDSEPHLQGCIHSLDLGAYNPPWILLSPARSNGKAPSPRTGATMVFDPRISYAYMWGGRDVNGSPQTGMWRTKLDGEDSIPLNWERLVVQNEQDAPDPSSDCHHSMVITNEGHIFIHARHSTTANDTLHSFNPSTLAWTKMAEPPVPSSTRHYSINFTLIFTMIDSHPSLVLLHETDTLTLDIYDIQTNTWTTTSNTLRPDRSYLAPLICCGGSFVPFSTTESGAIALLLHGNDELMDDIWLLSYYSSSKEFLWKKLMPAVESKQQRCPTARSKFACAPITIPPGKTAGVVVHGGVLVDGNTRADDLWCLQID